MNEWSVTSVSMKAVVKCKGQLCGVRMQELLLGGLTVLCTGVAIVSWRELGGCVPQDSAMSHRRDIGNKVWYQRDPNESQTVWTWLLLALRLVLVLNVWIHNWIIKYSVHFYFNFFMHNDHISSLPAVSSSNGSDKISLASNILLSRILPSDTSDTFVCRSHKPTKQTLWHNVSHTNINNLKKNNESQNCTSRVRYFSSDILAWFIAAYAW